MMAGRRPEPLVPLDEDLPPEVRALAEHLRVLFAALEVSVRGYAAARHYNPGTVSRYLSGRRVPPAGFIEDLIAAVSPVAPVDRERIRALFLEALRVSNTAAYRLETALDQARAATAATAVPAAAAPAEPPLAAEPTAKAVRARTPRPDAARRRRGGLLALAGAAAAVLAAVFPLAGSCTAHPSQPLAAVGDSNRAPATPGTGSAPSPRTPATASSTTRTPSTSTPTVATVVTRIYLTRENFSPHIDTGPLFGANVSLKFTGAGPAIVTFTEAGSNKPGTPGNINSRTWTEEFSTEDGGPILMLGLRHCDTPYYGLNATANGYSTYIDWPKNYGC